MISISNFASFFGWTISLFLHNFFLDFLIFLAISKNVCFAILKLFLKFDISRTTVKPKPPKPTKKKGVSESENHHPPPQHVTICFPQLQYCMLMSVGTLLVGWLQNPDPSRSRWRLPGVKTVSAFNELRALIGSFFYCRNL